MSGFDSEARVDCYLPDVRTLDTVDIASTIEQSRLEALMSAQPERKRRVPVRHRRPFRKKMMRNSPVSGTTLPVGACNSRKQLHL